jgi:hypothetical protein
MGREVFRIRLTGIVWEERPTSKQPPSHLSISDLLILKDFDNALLILHISAATVCEHKIGPKAFITKANAVS